MRSRRRKCSSLITRAECGYGTAIVRSSIRPWESLGSGTPAAMQVRRDGGASRWWAAGARAQHRLPRRGYLPRTPARARYDERRAGRGGHRLLGLGHLQDDGGSGPRARRHHRPLFLRGRGIHGRLPGRSDPARIGRPPRAHRAEPLCRLDRHGPGRLPRRRLPRRDGDPRVVPPRSRRRRAHRLPWALEPRVVAAWGRTTLAAGLQTARLTRRRGHRGGPACRSTEPERTARRGVRTPVRRSPASGSASRSVARRDRGSVWTTA